ncbi:MAG: polysaccharide export protein [Flavobacteriaceae bacterium]|nr:MAG: polysaccharide export protein [Flavobacteriaceae bacterium]
MKNKIFFIPFCMVVLALLVASCASKKEMLYFNQSLPVPQDSFQWSEIYIQPNDILSVKITTDVPELALAYNIAPSQQNNIQGVSAQLQGYLVANDGTINIPVLGVQQLKGLTLDQAEKQIQKALIEKGFLKNPVVICRLLNAKFTILGEVKAPGTYTFYENSLTLLQALGYSGDLTINGIRKITIIRTENGKQTYGTIDLTKSDWFTSPYYFVKPNDVIIVDPNTAKIKSSGIIGNAGSVISVISVLLSSLIIIRSL